MFIVVTYRINANVCVIQRLLKQDMNTKVNKEALQIILDALMADNKNKDLFVKYFPGTPITSPETGGRPL